MSLFSDRLPLCVQPPYEETLSNAGPTRAPCPRVARDHRAQGSKAFRKALSSIDPLSVERALVEAKMPSLPTRTAPKGPGIDAACLEKHALPAGPLDLEAALVALEHAATEEEVMACVATFLASATTFPPDMDPFAVLTTLFGSECATAVTEAGAAAVVELEAEAAATGSAVLERAASRITRHLVHRVTSRTGRTRAYPPQARRAYRVRSLRAPRSRRAPRHAVRLSAVASAGDGPPPEEPPPATRAPDGGHLSPGSVGSTSVLPTAVVFVSDRAVRATEAMP